MDEALWHKFTQHLGLQAELLATGDAELVEVWTPLFSPPIAQTDYWGCCSGLRQGCLLGCWP